MKGFTNLEPGQPFVSKGRDGVSEKGDRQENQEGLIRLEIIGDASSIGILKHIEAGDEKQSCSKVDGERDCYVSSNV